MTTPTPTWFRLPAFDLVAIPRYDDAEDHPAIRPDESTCVSCKEGVGIVLLGDKDDPAWRPVWIAYGYAEQVLGLLCEDCATVVEDLAKAAAAAPPATAPLPAGLSVGDRIEVVEGQCAGRVGTISAPGPWTTDGAAVVLDLAPSLADLPGYRDRFVTYSARSIRRL